MDKLIYVAGGSPERPMIQSFMRGLRENGWTITHDWTVNEGYDRPLSESEKLDAAESDLHGVWKASLVWCIVPREKSEGMGTELGYAFGIRRPLVISGPWFRNIFCRLPESQARHGMTIPRMFDDHTDAFQYILRLP